MQLTVREVSKFLDVSQATITRWIKQRGLPAQYVNGQFRFNRSELLEWATANQIKVSLEMFSHLESEDEPIPSLAEALRAGGIFSGLQGSNKVEVLRSLVKVLPLPLSIDRDLLLRLFLAREASASTGIGGGIALPHVRNPIVLHVESPMVILCFLERPIDFGALDGQPVRVLFSMICPTMRSHLQTISRLSYALHDPKFREIVLRQGTREEVLGAIQQIESSMSVPAPERGKGTN
jgi:PTS system nitrogen regulatory IIA component